MNPKKPLAALLAAATAVALAACGPSSGGGGDSGTPEPAPEPTYKLYIEGFEWGPSVTGAVLDFGAAVDPSSVSPAAFTATSTVAGMTGEVETAREIKAAYVSDESGNPAAGESSYVTLEFSYGAEMGFIGGQAITGQSPFSYDFVTGLNSWIDANYTFTVTGLTVGGTAVESLDIPADAYTGRISPSTDDLVKGSHTLDGLTLTWAAYETAAMAQDAGQNALIVWLHGAGEGGTDVDIPLLGADVTELMADTVQQYFQEGGLQGAYVLVVQTPTMWMDSGSGQHAGDEGSLYTEVLKDTIDAYVASNPDVDPARIIIGGCSNGGYMTVNMAVTYPGYFAAAFPVAEAYMDSFLTGDKLAALVDLPLWFTQSRDDSTVAPVLYAVPTFVRLLQAGAPDVHLSFFDTVTGYDDPAVTYYGHWSWVYALADRSVLDVDHAWVLANADAILAACAELGALAAPDMGAADPRALPADVFPASSVPVEYNGRQVTMWGWLAAVTAA